jgi:hypothetical protein
MRGCGLLSGRQGPLGELDARLRQADELDTLALKGDLPAAKLGSDLFGVR